MKRFVLLTTSYVLYASPQESSFLNQKNPDKKNKEGKIIQNCIFCKLSMINFVFDEQVQIFVSGPVLYLLHLAQSSRRPRILQHYALTFSKFSEPSLASCEDCELAERGKLYDPLTYCTDERGTNCKTQIQIQTLWSSLTLRRAKIQITEKCENKNSFVLKGCAMFTKHYFSKLGLGNFMTLLRIWHKGKL